MKKYILVLGLLILWGCQEDIPREELPAPNKSGREVSNFTLIETDGQIKKWTLKAKRAVFKEVDGEAEQILNIQDYKVNFHEESGQPDTVLTGKIGTYNRNTQEILTSRAVTITREDKKVLTSNVKWDPDEEIFITEEKVEIHDEGGVIRGRGMTATRDLEKITIMEQVSAEVK